MLLTRKELQARLEEAGAILLSLPGGHGPASFKSNLPQPIQDACEAYGWANARLRTQRPTGAQIQRMDEALAWVSLIPASPAGADPATRNGGATLRRVVHCRLLVKPQSWYETPNHPKHIFSWRQLAVHFGASHTALQTWHAAALGCILAGLARRSAA